MLMLKIKQVLDLPIQKGYIKWVKLEEKIHAALSLVQGDFKAFKPDGTDASVQLEDAVDFEVTTPQGKFIYKIIEPRFHLGDLCCSGYQLGIYKEDGTPWFNPQTLVRF